MKPVVNISFGKSSSYHFATAVDLAASLPGYRQQGQGQQVRHLVEFAVSLEDDAWDKLERLMQLIMTWRSASIAVDAKAINPRKLLRSIIPIKQKSASQKAQPHIAEAAGVAPTDLAKTNADDIALDSSYELQPIRKKR